jgi:hypothetical protein
VIHADRRVVVEQHRLSTADLGRYVGGGGVVAHDLQIGRCVGQQRVVEPGQVLAHQAARQVVGGEDLHARGVNPALVAQPAIALGDRPLVETYGVRAVLVGVRGRVERQLSAGIVEYEVVGLLRGVNAAAQLSRLNHV